MSAGKSATVATAGDKPDCAPLGLLDSLRRRFKERAELSRVLEADFVKIKNYHEAEKCVIRRDIWEYAAEMVEQEKLCNND